VKAFEIAVQLPYNHVHDKSCIIEYFSRMNANGKYRDRCPLCSTKLWGAQMEQRAMREIECVQNVGARLTEAGTDSWVLLSSLSGSLSARGFFFTLGASFATKWAGWSLAFDEMD
jgi:hypothetical protein